MNVSEFRKKVKLSSILKVDEKEFSIREIIKFRFDDGNFYMKLFLNDGYVLADDLSEDSFVLVKRVDTDISEPFSGVIEYDSKKFNFMYSAHAVAEEVQGEEIFKKGEGEKFWDYQSGDEDYLSLGVDDKGEKRMDFYGKIIKGEKIEIA